MATTLDVSTDYLLWDNYISATLRVRNAVGDYTSTTIARCFHAELSQKEIEASEGKYIAGDRAFNLPTALLGGATPKVGDRLVVSTSDDTLTIDEGDQLEYRLIESTRKVWGTDWRVVVRCPFLAYSLHDIISIRRPTITPGETTGWSYLFQSIRASVQMMNRATSTDAGNFTLGPTYHIAIAEEAEDVASILRQDQVVLNDGALLEIEEIRTPNRLAELTVLVCAPEISSPVEPGV